jgi:hypothetical protein
MDPATAQLDKDPSSFEEDILEYVMEKLMEQHNKPFNHRRTVVAATDTSIRFSGGLPMAGSAITSSSQPIPCSNSDYNSNDITSITNMTSLSNMGLVDANTVVEGVMSLGGLEWFQRLHFAFPLCALLF